MRKNLLFTFALILTCFGFFSCRTTGTITIPVSLPPQVFVPEHVQKVGLVNRSLASGDRGTKTANVIEGILSGESVADDKKGSWSCLIGAETQLTMDQMLEASILDSVILEGTGTGVMQAPLSWDEVERICQQNGVDALLVLEVFDTDQQNSVTTNAIRQIRTVAETGEVRPVAPNPNTRIHIKMGWRLYDPQEKQLLDEVRMSDFIGVNGRTSSGIYDPGEFAKRDALQTTSYIAGRAYGNRMFPSWTRVRRTYYRRRGEGMKQATRLAEVNDFDAALQAWEALANHPKRKIAGRASYNTAIGYEIKGDLPMALEWAKKAYTQYGEKRARSYAKILQNRIRSGI